MRFCEDSALKRMTMRARAHAEQRWCRRVSDLHFVGRKQAYPILNTEPRVTKQLHRPRPTERRPSDVRARRPAAVVCPEENRRARCRARNPPGNRHTPDHAAMSLIVSRPTPVLMYTSNRCDSMLSSDFGWHDEIDKLSSYFGLHAEIDCPCYLRLYDQRAVVFGLRVSMEMSR